ncbi:MAG: MFS transporter [Burkholderiales bacterium]|nr:MFS transporter [Burkholderiales bacterium]
MLSVAVPLYAVAVGLNAAQIGLIISARSVLPAVLSIHGGIIMDELGTRRVLVWVAACSILLPLLFPMTGWFAVLGMLQLLLGLATSLGLAASQTWSMQTSHGDTAILARYSVATRVGTFIGPVVVGAAWDVFGAWAAFACVSAAAAGIIAASAGTRSPADPRSNVRPNLAALLPNWTAHKQALRLALVPAVAFILAASFLRNASGAIQSSLFVVHLNETGMSGTLIGMLVSIAELSGVFGSLAAAAAQRRMHANRLVIVCTVVSLTAICLTPLLAPVFLLLAIAAAVRGISQGMSQPLMYAVLTHGVPGGRHGVSVGLRSAVVRLGAIVTPALMGFIAEAQGIAASFYIIGAIYLIATALLALAERGLPR